MCVLRHARVVIFSTRDTIIVYVRYYFHELMSQEIKDVLFFGLVLHKLTPSSVQDGTCALQKDHMHSTHFSCPDITVMVDWV